MPGQPILIHVPKCGGTTLVMAITGARMPPKANDVYRHIRWNESRTEMLSNAGDIFEPEGRERYAGRKIILAVRNPLDRQESEFGFLSNRELFRNLWKAKSGEEYPATFLEYVSSPTASNSICKFLLGWNMYDGGAIGSEEIDRIIDRFDEDFVFGLTHEMALTTQNVEHRCGLEFDDQLPRHRTSLYKPERGDDWGKVEDAFREHNAADLQLFEEVSRRFAQQAAELPENTDRSFVGDVYASLLLFTTSEERRSPLEIYANDLSDPKRLYDWVTQRKHELVLLNQMAMQGCGQDGRKFLNNWLERAIPQYLPGSADQLVIDPEEPMVTLRTLVRTLFEP